MSEIQTPSSVLIFLEFGFQTEKSVWNPNFKFGFQDPNFKFGFQTLSKIQTVWKRDICWLL